jgi:hypothetical protein
LFRPKTDATTFLAISFTGTSSLTASWDLTYIDIMSSAYCCSQASRVDSLIVLKGLRLDGQPQYNFQAGHADSIPSLALAVQGSFSNYLMALVEDCVPDPFPASLAASGCLPGVPGLGECLAHTRRDLLIPLAGGVQADARGPRALVAHPLNELPEARALGGGHRTSKLVTRVRFPSPALAVQGVISRACAGR